MTATPKKLPRETLTEQLDREKRAVSYDMYDMNVRQLVDMVENGEINIAPEYQRHFVWDPERESELIESIYLGIPVPSLYMAANPDGTWEVVDGVQRLSTLTHFCGTATGLEQIGKSSPLKITNLKKLTRLNDIFFESLPKPLQLNFQLRPVRVTTLNDKSDSAVRYDLFERLNTGGVKLHEQEIRNCVFRGGFRNLLKELSNGVNFRKVVKLPDNEQKSAIYEECVLRFFAYLQWYEAFEHSVTEFLNDYMVEYSIKGPGRAEIDSFHKTFAQLARVIPGGISRTNRTTTPLNLFEAIAVGSALAIKTKKSVNWDRLPSILGHSDLKHLTTGATNSRTMVTGRINFVRDRLVK